MTDKLQVRNREFMQGIDLDTVRRQREDFSVEFRKQRRYEHSAKRRLFSQEESENEALPGPNKPIVNWVPEELRGLIPELAVDGLSNQRKLELLLALLRACTDEGIVLLALRAIRHSTCKREDLLMSQIVQIGMLPVLVDLAQRKSESVTSEVTWILCNLASSTSENTSALVASPAFPLCVQLISSDCADIQEHAMWTIGNIAGDSIFHRDMLIRLHIHKSVIYYLNNLPCEQYMKVIRVSAWVLCNLVRGKPLVAPELYSEVLDAIRLPMTYKDKELKSNLFSILEATCQSGTSGIDQILSRSFLPKVMRTILSKHKRLSVAALKIIGLICASNDTHTQLVLDCDLFGKLLSVIGSKDHSVRYNVFYILANVAAGSRLQLTKLFDHTIALLALQGVSDLNERIRLEASYLLYNTVKVGNSQHVGKLVNMGAIQYFRGALKCTHPEFLFNILTVILHLLRFGKEEAEAAGEGLNFVLVSLQQYECIELIESLAHHENPKVQQKAGLVLTQYVDIFDHDMPDAAEPPSEFLL